MEAFGDDGCEVGELFDLLEREGRAGVGDDGFELLF
jgi:hypothetical protein